MKVFFTFLLLVMGLRSFAQTEEKTVKVGLNCIEKYSVLKSAKKIKQGKYTFGWIGDSTSLKEGFYKNNLRDSLWQYRNIKGTLIASGTYNYDKKIGVWDGYTFQGQLQVKYDYTNKKLLFYKVSPDDTSAVYSVINGNDTVYEQLQRPPIYLDGSGLLQQTLMENITMPKEAKEAQVQGRVMVTFTIDSDGTTTDVRVKWPVGYGYDEAAIKAVNSLKGDWFPGMLNGKPVAVEYVIPINFQLKVE